MKRKFVIFTKMFVFLLIFAFFFTKLSYISRKWIAHTTGNISGFYGLKRNSLDICFIGTSGTFSAFCPMQAWKEQGFASYNFCINVLGADAIVYAIKEVQKTQKKAVVVIDLFPFISHHLVHDGKMADYAIRYNTDGYKYSLNRFKLITKLLPKDKKKLSYYFDLLKYHDNKLEFCTYGHFLSNFSHHSIIKGYNNLPWGVTSPAIKTNEISALEPEYDKALDELLEYCRHSRQKILFLYYPYGETRTEYGLSCDSLAYINYMKEKILKDFELLNCEDFVDDFSFDYSLDFWNSGHWNIYGAEKITRVLGEKFVQMYNLKNRQTEEKYKSWNEDIPEWDKYVKSSKASVLEQRNSSGNL